MNFLTRLFGSLFNKDRTAPTTVTDRGENRQAEKLCAEPEPDVTVFAPFRPQADTETPAATPTQPLDTTPANPPTAAEEVKPAASGQPDAPSSDAATRGEPPAPELSADSTTTNAASKVASDAAESANPVKKTEFNETPEKETAEKDTPETANKKPSPSAEKPDPSNDRQPGGAMRVENAQADKHDIDAMTQGCEVELKKKRSHKDVPSPYFFERAAILSRKEKNYQQEIDYCERYIKMTESFYKKHGTEGLTDIREGAKHRAIVERLPKARALLQKQQTKKA